MPPGGVHLAAGLAFLKAGKRATKATKSEETRALSIGFITGSILPDADLLLCILIGSVTHIDESDLKVVHRTFTHSLLIIPLVAAALVQLFQTLEVSEHKGARKAMHACAQRLGLLGGGEQGASGSCPSASRVLTHFVVGAAGGCAFHSVLDLFYVMKLKIFWPYPYELGIPFFSLDALTERGKKVIMMCDFAADVVFWYLPILIQTRRARMDVGKAIDLFLVCLISSYVACLGFFWREAWIGDDVTTVHFTRRLYIVGTIWVLALKVSPFFFDKYITGLVFS